MTVIIIVGSAWILIGLILTLVAGYKNARGLIMVTAGMILITTGTILLAICAVTTIILEEINLIKDFMGM